jgi:segregation and condensation protein B
MEEQEPQQAEIRPDEPVSVEELIPEVGGTSSPEAAPALGDTVLRAVIEALVYVAEEPLTVAQMATALNQPAARIEELIRQLADEFEKPEHGVAIREVAGGYKMATKAEHHEAVRAFAKSLKPPLKLSLAALETLAVIAYKQPVTAPEIQEIRGVQGTGVVKTLLDRKLIVMAGRKAVIGKPILYRTTKEFLVQFGLKDLSELPSLKEFEEIRRVALADDGPEGQPAVEPAQEPAATEPRETPPSEAPAAEEASPEPGTEPEGDGPSKPEE